MKLEVILVQQFKDAAVFYLKELLPFLLVISVWLWEQLYDWISPSILLNKLFSNAHQCLHLSLQYMYDVTLMALYAVLY